MELVKCPICGEMYSESYKACPFCAESGPYEGTVKRRKGAGRRVQRRKTPKILGPAMILVLLLLAAVLVYAFFGDQIKAKLHPDSGEKTPVAEVQLTVEPVNMELSVGEIRALTASGADSYVWSSSDETVATVDENGNVTAVGVGTATISVADKGDRLSARCVVTVQETGVEPVEPGTDDPGTDDPGTDDPGTDDPGTDEPGTDEPVVPEGKLTMCALWNRRELPTVTVDGETMYDMTLGSGSTTLYIEGTRSDVYWSSDSAAVTVNSEGLVTRVGWGTAIITATVDGQTLKCRVLG